MNLSKAINKNFIIALSWWFLIVVSPNSFATESVFCEDGNYIIVLFFNMDQSFAGFQLYVNGQLEDTKDVRLEKINIDFKRRNIEFIAQSFYSKSIRLNAKYKIGNLYIDNREYKVFCDWSAFEDF